MLSESIQKDIQGIILYGYAHMTAASYLMLHIKDKRVEDAKKWLQVIGDKLTHAGGKKTETCINIAFTWQGLKKFGLPETAMDTFPRPFQEGMTMPHKSLGFGDIGESAPENWEWGNEDEAHEIHMVLMLFGESQEVLDKYQAKQIIQLDAHGIQVMHQLDTEPYMLTSMKEHFGFTDGIGQPGVEGVGKKKSFADNTIKLGEFVLGHLNEYDKYPDAPYVPTDLDKKSLLESLPKKPFIRDLGKNGSFLAFRQMEQHVVEFWKYMSEVVEERKKAGEDENMVRIASKMVGRWPNGTPLALDPDKEIKAKDPNNFGYAQSDAKGMGCPIGAHLRRANPRDAFTDDPKKSIDFVKKNRIIRRGRGYGKPIDENFDPKTILEIGESDKQKRGLHFLVFNANLARQFELVQKQWLCNPKFLGLYDEVDPVVGHHYEFEGYRFNEFTEPAKPVRKKSAQIPRFVTIKGGAYFFMPGIKAVQFLAAM